MAQWKRQSFKRYKIKRKERDKRRERKKKGVAFANWTFLRNQNGGGCCLCEEKKKRKDNKSQNEG